MTDTNKKQTGKTAEGFSKTPKPLKPKRKISKRSQSDGIVDIDELKGTLQLQQENSKKSKKILVSKQVGTNTEKEDDAKTLKVRRMKQKNAGKGEHSEMRQDSIRIREKHDVFQKKQRDEMNNKSSQLKKNEESQIDKVRHGHNGNKKEKLGGLIFMCSEKTKSDCFRYRVMGVPMGKKETVLGVKPGLKLFLYDIDLRVMYGIYKASSSGGMKLESEAFNGSFPVQVRFNVHQDCYPLPESIFKRAIKENYTGVHRFKLELSVQQVKKLIGLFRPADVQSHAQPNIHPPPVMVEIQDREVNEGARESWVPSHRESLAGDPTTHGGGRRYHLISNEHNQHLTYKEVPPIGRDVSQDFYPSEKEYRAYGLLRTERQSPRKSAPTFESYSRGYVREQPPPPVTIKDREIIEGAREPRAHLYSEPLSIDPRTYAGSRRYHVLSNVSDQHLAYKEVPPIERENFSQDYYPSEKEYRTYGLRREGKIVSPPRSHITPTAEPSSRDHGREHLVMRDSHLVTGKPFETYSLVPIRELQSTIPLLTPTIPSTLDSYSKDPYYAYSKGGSALDPYQLPSRREEVPLGSYSLGGRGETYPSVTDHLQTRDNYLTPGDQSRQVESYLTESNHLGRMEVKDMRMLHPTYASSALSYYDRIQKYPEVRTETSHAPLSSLYSLAGPSFSNR